MPKTTKHQPTKRKGATSASSAGFIPTVPSLSATQRADARHARIESLMADPTLDGFERRIADLAMGRDPDAPTSLQAQALGIVADARLGKHKGVEEGKPVTSTQVFVNGQLLATIGDAPEELPAPAEAPALDAEFTELLEEDNDNE